MAANAKRRSVMTLYSGANCPLSHRTRIVLSEKNVTAEIIMVEKNNLPEDLIDLNPYNTLPTLVDRDLALFNSKIIMEYLDERYPHPPLMPVEPVLRARTRLMLYRIDRDWYSQLPDILGKDDKKAAKARKVIRDGLTVIAPIFEQKDYFISDEFSLLDCSVAPLLWRLPYYNIQLTAAAKPVLKYAERLFERESFQISLTEAERELRD
ncbi:MAG: glutathione S-transferase N-terminal domain-containing protein [Gammaproteobacteria bacterium]|nr:glutathione S-transferase N-terminal domain-containing protein [Gammaproteobacteria bacterium]